MMLKLNNLPVKPTGTKFNYGNGIYNTKTVAHMRTRKDNKRNFSPFSGSDKVTDMDVENVGENHLY